jgi:Transposase IS116/IS110/IS902 family
MLNNEVMLVEQTIASDALTCPEMRRLLTIPGVNAVTACALVGAIGDISRFPTSRHLVAYIGLDPRVSQSGNEPARHGRISKANDYWIIDAAPSISRCRAFEARPVASATVSPRASRISSMSAVGDERVARASWARTSSPGCFGAKEGRAMVELGEERWAGLSRLCLGPSRLSASWSMPRPRI